MEEKQFQAFIEQIRRFHESVNVSRFLVTADQLRIGKELRSAARIAKSAVFTINSPVAPVIQDDLLGVIRHIDESIKNLRMNGAALADSTSALKDLARIGEEWQKIYRSVGVVHLDLKDLERIRSELDDNEFDGRAEWIDLETGFQLPNDTRKALIQTRFLSWRLLEEILKRPEKMHNITSRQFEEFVAELLDKLGCKNVELTPRSGDNNRDVIGTFRVRGIDFPLAVECRKKRPDRKVEKEELVTLLGAINRINTPSPTGILATTSTFTSGAAEVIEQEVRLNGMSYYDIEKEWISPVHQLLHGRIASDVDYN
jgi:hypothetical protein